VEHYVADEVVTRDQICALSRCYDQSQILTILTTAEKYVAGRPWNAIGDRKRLGITWCRIIDSDRRGPNGDCEGQELRVGLVLKRSEERRVGREESYRWWMWDGV